MNHAQHERLNYVPLFESPSYDLPYASQHGTVYDRMLEQARKVRRRLGAPENLCEPLGPWHKPKGMHWKTFSRLVAQEQSYNQASILCLWRALPQKGGDKFHPLMLSDLRPPLAIGSARAKEKRPSTLTCLCWRGERRA